MKYIILQIIDETVAELAIAIGEQLELTDNRISELREEMKQLANETAEKYE